LLTDRQTDKHTDKRRIKQNLIGGGMKKTETKKLNWAWKFTLIRKSVQAVYTVEMHSLRNTYVSGLTTRVKVKKIYTRCLKKKHDFAPQPQTTVSPTDA